MQQIEMHTRQAAGVNIQKLANAASSANKHKPRSQAIHKTKNMQEMNKQ